VAEIIAARYSPALPLPHYPSSSASLDRPPPPSPLQNLHRPPAISLPLSSRAPTPYGTCHIRRSALTFVAPDPQLANKVRAPALDLAPGRDRARVVIPHGYGDG
jgi:hypothetical protein